MKARAEKSANRPAKTHRTPFFSTQKMQPFFSAPRIQTKLTVGQPGDKYEQEADRVAAQVVDMTTPREMQQTATAGRHPDGHLQRACVASKDTVNRQSIESEEDIQMQEMEEEERLQESSRSTDQRLSLQPLEDETDQRLSLQPLEDEEEHLQRQTMKEEEELLQGDMISG